MVESTGLSLAERFTLGTLKQIRASGRVDAQTAANLFSLGLLTAEDSAVVNFAGIAMIEFLEAKEKAFFSRIPLSDLVAEVEGLERDVVEKEKTVQRLTFDHKQTYFLSRLAKYRALQSAGSDKDPEDDQSVVI